MKFAESFVGFLGASTLLGACQGDVHHSPRKVDRYVIAALSVGIDSAIRSSIGGYPRDNSEGWKVIVADTSDRWSHFFLRRHLAMYLNAGDSMRATNRRGIVSISKVQLNKDVAKVRVRLVREYRCEVGRWIGSITDYEVESVWLGRQWSDGVPRAIVSKDPPKCVTSIPTSNIR